jgi:O-antigen/teichoic acid export membrane protein
VNIILILLAIIIDTDAGWLSKQEFIRFYFYSFLACGLLLFTLFIKTYCNWRRLATFVSVIELRHLLRYSFLSFLSNIIAFLLFRVDYFFVEKYCTNSDLGNYIQVSKLSQLFFVVPGILASIVFPMTAGGMKKEVNSHLPVLSRIIFFFFGNACIFLVLTGKFIFPYFFGDSFTSMYQIFLLMIPGILGLAIIFPLTAYYAGKKKMGVNIRGCLYTVLLMIVADFVVVPVYKITGATVVCSLSYLIYGVYVIFHFGKEYGIAFKDFIIIRRSDFRFITGKMI